VADQAVFVVARAQQACFLLCLAEVAAAEAAVSLAVVVLADRLASDEVEGNSPEEPCGEGSRKGLGHQVRTNGQLGHRVAYQGSHGRQDLEDTLLVARSDEVEEGSHTVGRLAGTEIAAGSCGEGNFAKADLAAEPAGFLDRVLVTVREGRQECGVVRSVRIESQLHPPTRARGCVLEVS